MGGDVLIGAILILAIVSLLAILARERSNPRPVGLTLDLLFILVISFWLAGNAVITGVTRSPN
jgi:hypothetical protein